MCWGFAAICRFGEGGNLPRATGGVFVYHRKQPGAIFGANTKGRFRWLQDYSDTALAENSPFSREEALAFLQKTIAPYVQACGSFAYEVRKMYVESRGYKVRKSDSSGETLDYGTTCTEMGVYQIVFNQVFHGIPYLALSLPFTWPLKVEEGLMLAVGEIRAAVASETDYALAFHPVVVGVVGRDESIEFEYWDGEMESPDS